MKTIHISNKANSIILDYLKGLGYEINLINGSPKIEASIREHADLYMCALPNFIYHGKEEISSPYPNDVSYNAVCLGKYFIHNLKYTAKDLLGKIDKLKLTKINVKQGYTKCNMVIVNGSSAITSDEGIYKTLKTHAPDLDILKIEHGHVSLPGHEYGFLGGASGKIGSTVVFHGNLEEHADFEIIKSFIENRGLEIKYFKEFPLTDLGSMIED